MRTRAALAVVAALVVLPVGRAGSSDRRCERGSTASSPGVEG